MKTRGESQYIHMPVFAARLYDNLTSVKGVNKGFEEIASFISKRIKKGRFLDIGTGPGRLLLEDHKRNPEFELYGMDISESMLEVAKQNLKDIGKADLQVGNIAKTEYPDDFFDCITSTGSFYNWDKPVEGLNEIFRIVKPGNTAFIFESFQDYDKILLNKRLKENLRDYSVVRKVLSRYFLKRQIRMTYTLKEFEGILKKSMFHNSYLIEKIELGNLPIYVRIELNKPRA